MNPEEDAKQFDKVNWNIKHKMRENGLQIDQPPPLSLGAPAIDYDVIKIRQAKDRNPTYSPKEIYYDILKESVPLINLKTFTVLMIYLVNLMFMNLKNRKKNI